MQQLSEDYVELEVVAAIVGEPVHTLPQLCRVLGLKTQMMHNVAVLSRSALRTLYDKLHPTYKPPEAARPGRAQAA